MKLYHKIKMFINHEQAQKNEHIAGMEGRTGQKGSYNKIKPNEKLKSVNSRLYISSVRSSLVSVCL